LALEMGHQLLDFRVLGQEDFRRAVLFVSAGSENRPGMGTSK